MNSRKGMTILVCLLIIGSVCVFAGGGRSADSSKPFSGTVLNGIIVSTADTDYMISTLAPRLKQETGIDLRIESVPYEEIRARQLADATGAKRYDIINPCTEWSFEYAQFGAPLNKYVGRSGFPDIEVNDIIPYVWKEFNPTNNIYWFPYQPDTRVFLYRSDLLSAAGLSEPKTWDDVLNIARAMTKDGRYGFGFPARRGWNLTLAWAPLLFAAGGELFDANNQPVFNSQAGVDALNFLIELKKYCPPDIDAYGEYEQNEALKSGLIAMGISASGVTPELETGRVKGLYRSIPFPVKAGITPKYSAVL